MNGTNKNMQIKKIALFIKYLKELLDISFTSPLASLHFYISLLLYKSICFASLPYISLQVYWLRCTAIYLFNKSIGFASILYISFIL